jgi:AcrR family transcriptional regulator
MVSATEPTRLHPRARRRAETVTELLDHAERVVLGEGLEALSMHRLAAEHGVRVAALYRYWPSKDALLSALLERAVLRLRESVSAIEPFEAELVQRPGKSWSEGEKALLRLVRLGGVYFDLARPTLEPAPDSQLLLHAMAIVTEASAAFARASEHGALAAGNATQRAALYWTSLQGLVASAKLTRFGIAGDRASLERALIETLLIGWGAAPELLARPLDRGLTF